MKRLLLQAACLFAWLTLPVACTNAVEPDAVKPKVIDALRPVRLTKPELSGEIGRRLDDLIYKNYMVIDLERDFLDPFRKRPPLAKDGRRYVGIGKVIDAGSMFSAYTGDPDVQKRTEKLVNELMNTQDADGYLGHMPVEPEGRQNYRNWTLHDQEYAVLGLVDDWRYCGNKKSLDAARRLADYVLTTFPKNPRPDTVCTAGLPEAMLTLYGCTGDARYLRFAADQRHGYPHCETECSSLSQWDKGPLNDKTLLRYETSHTYVNMARCCAQIMLYHWEPQEKLLKMSRFILGEMTRKGGCLFITGSASDREQFSYTQNGLGNVSESCVTAYLIRWFDSLMRLDGDLRQGDLMERAIYNALFAAQDPAGRRLRYFTAFEGPRVYFPIDGFCCPGNYRRIVAQLPEMVYYRTKDGGVAVNLFTESKGTIDLGAGRNVTIQQRTDYPTSGLVKMTVTPSAAMEFPLRLRVPRWCPEAKLTINNEAPVTVRPGKEFHEIRRTWNPSDTVTLDMPMPWRWVRGHRIQEGRVALMRGPVVYCIGAAANAELLKKYKNPGDLVIDPASLGTPVADASVRPGGWKVTAKTLPLFTHDADSTPLDVVFTEFVDPTGIATYVHVSDLTNAVEDELLSEK
ncbi:MAG TPA: beta-L-arabinofuranosidase domain-containing protein [Thermoguttaceae bacterium]|nr:beta-L-arabinofuranosidase domain-containing protein [Thermoguttaceae bacterium]